MIAFLNGESGADVVEDKLTEPGSTCSGHAHNLCEVYYLYYRAGGAAVGDGIIEDLLAVGVLPRDDLDTAFWKEAGSYKGRHPPSLPDAFCITLARRIGGTAVTTDHHEFDALVPLTYCPILFIR